MIKNPFIDPFYLFRIATTYYTDIHRPWKKNFNNIRKFRNKSIRKMIRIAFKTPIYNQKYKEYGIHPDEIKTIDDIKKLPFITKEDLQKHFPYGVIPHNFNTANGFLLSTSGSTGMPVSIYYDHFSSIKNLIATVISLKAYGGNWNKSKIAIIQDFSPRAVENAIFKKSMLPFLQYFKSMNNILLIHIGEKPESIIKKLNKFQPEFINSYPNIFRIFANMKNSGYGLNFNSFTTISSGGMLDSYTRKYIEQTFNSKIMDFYATTEAGPIAFECVEGGFYHIFSNFVYLECLDKEKNPVEYGKPGYTVITRLYGGGTPIIRYTGIDDMVIQCKKETNCNINSEIIKQIEGRSADMITCEDGAIISPLLITSIPAKTMEYFNTYKIKQFQIIQNEINNFEIKIVINEKLRNDGVSVSVFINELKKRFKEKLGNGSNITVTEVDSIQKDSRADYVKVVISKVK